MDPMNKIFQNTLSGSSSVSDPKMIDTIKDTIKKLRPGIGTRSKLLFTHPRNKELLIKLIKTVEGNNKDIFMPFPYRVIVDANIPIKEDVKTGKILWKDDKFTAYSSGPSGNMSWKDYLDMCLYFGWAKEEYVSQLVWYEADENTFENFMTIGSTVENFPREDDREMMKLLGREYSLLTKSRQDYLKIAIFTKGEA